MAKNSIQSPNYAMYGSDPIQQIFARGVLDPEQGGIAYMFKNAADRQKQQGIDAYEQGIREANQMSTILAQREIANEWATNVLKASAGLMEKGLAPSGFKMAGELFNDPNGNDAYSQAVLGKLFAEAAASNAKASEAGQDKYTVDGTVTPGGLADIRYKGVGRNPDALQKVIQARIWADWEARKRANAGNKGGPVAPPNPNLPPPNPNVGSIPEASQTDVQRLRDRRYNRE